MTHRETDTDVAALWRDYQAGRDPALRNRLVLHYAPLVKYVAGRLRSGLPANVDHADLVSDGVIGLMDAIDKFQPERGWQFQTYAVGRIRGAIIDSLRAVDWVPRSVRARVREIEAAQVRLEASLGRTPTDEEVAEEVGLQVRELRQTYSQVSLTNLADAEEVGVADVTATPPGQGLEDDEARAVLKHAMRELPERDAVVLALYYFEGLTLAEIGQVLGVSESRVSQLHTRATLTLRAKLKASLAA